MALFTHIKCQTTTNIKLVKSGIGTHSCAGATCTKIQTPTCCLHC